MITHLLSLESGSPGILASQQLASGDTTIYTAPAGRGTQIAGLVLCNTSGGAVTVSVSVIPSGGAVDGTHKVVSNYPLAANDSAVINEVAGQWITEGDCISVNAGTSSAVSVFLTGIAYA